MLTLSLCYNWFCGIQSAKDGISCIIFVDFLFYFVVECIPRMIVY